MQTLTPKNRTPPADQIRNTSNVRLVWVDYLRGIAAFCVVVFHVRVDLWVGLKTYFQSGLTHNAFEKSTALLFLPSPFLGSTVMLFFILSGFSIHHAYAGRTKEFELRIYAIRRFFRIYPPYLAAVTLSICIELIVNSLHLQKFAQYQGTGGSTYIASIFMLNNYLYPYKIIASNASLWSLPVEVEFYLAFPILYYVWRRLPTRWVLPILLLSSLFMLTVAHVSPSGWIVKNFVFYWIIWFSGALLADLLHSKKLPSWRWQYYIGLAVCFCTGMYLSSSYPVSNIAIDLIGKLFWALGYFIILLRVLTKSVDSSGVMSKDERPMSLLHNSLSWLGTVSYSLYLIHFPIFYLSGALYLKLTGVKPESPYWAIAGIVAVLPIAGVFYKVIEKPSHDLSRVLSQRLLKPIPNQVNQ